MDLLVRTFPHLYLEAALELLEVCRGHAALCQCGYQLDPLQERFASVMAACVPVAASVSASPPGSRSMGLSLAGLALLPVQHVAEQLILDGLLQPRLIGGDTTAAWRPLGLGKEEGPGGLRSRLGLYFVKLS